MVSEEEDVGVAILAATREVLFARSDVPRPRPAEDETEDRERGLD